MDSASGAEVLISCHHFSVYTGAASINFGRLNNSVVSDVFTTFGGLFLSGHVFLQMRFISEIIFKLILKYLHYMFQVETLSDELVPGHGQDQEEDDLLVVVRHPQEGLRRRPQSHPVERRRRPRKGLHRRHPQVHGQEVDDRQIARGIPRTQEKTEQNIIRGEGKRHQERSLKLAGNHHDKTHHHYVSTIFPS